MKYVLHAAGPSADPSVCSQVGQEPCLGAARRRGQAAERRGDKADLFSCGGRKSEKEGRKWEQ